VPILHKPGLQRNLARATRSVNMMLKQVGMKRALASGKFDDDMLAWSVAIMKHTGSFKSETDNNTFISLKGGIPRPATSAAVDRCSQSATGDPQADQSCPIARTGSHECAEPRPRRSCSADSSPTAGSVPLMVTSADGASTPSVCSNAIAHRSSRAAQTARA